MHLTQKMIEQLMGGIKWLERSNDQCSAIILGKKFTDEDFYKFESLTSRLHGLQAY